MHWHESQWSLAVIVAAAILIGATGVVTYIFRYRIRGSEFRLWSVSVLAIVVVGAGSLWAVRFHGMTEYWTSVVPGYLTGVGTIGLAALTYALMRQAIGDRNRQDSYRALDLREEQRRQARRVVILTGPSSDSGGIEVVNAGTEPIVDVRIISCEARGGSSSYEDQDTPRYTWRPGGRTRDNTAAILEAGHRWTARGTWSDGNGNLLAEDAGLDLPIVTRPEWGNPLPVCYTKVQWLDCWNRTWSRTNLDEPEHVLTRDNFTELLGPRGRRKRKR